MPKYHFKSHSLIDEISFFENDKGTSRAYLHAREGVDDNQLAGILTLLRHHDYDCVPYTLDNKPVLEVRNYGKPKTLLSKLKHEHIVVGEPAIERLEEDQISFKDRLSKRTLQISGLLQLIGDVGYYQYNKLEQNAEGKIASLFYFIGTAMLAGYGRNDQSEVQVRDMARGFESFLEKKGNMVPSDCALHAIAHEREKNPLLSTHAFIKRYPSEVYNTFTGLAGAMVAVNAYKNQYVKHYPAHYPTAEVAKLRQVGLMDIGLGLTTLAATTYGTMVKEKKHDPDEPMPQSFAGKAVQYVRNNPLSVTGGGLMVSTLIHAASTMKEYMVAGRMNNRGLQKTVSWRGLFVAANLMAELLIMVSSKGHGEGVTTDDTVHQTAYKMAAEVILNQPEDKREYMTNYIADFLQAPDVLAEKHEVVVTKLKQEIERLKHNPWLCKGTKQADYYDLPEDSHPHLQAHLQKGSWGEKMNSLSQIDGLEPRTPL